jgi:hypothetical protein
MREMCMSGSTSGMWKRGMAWIVRHRQTKEPDTDRPNLNHRATSRLYKCLTFQRRSVGDRFLEVSVWNCKIEAPAGSPDWSLKAVSRPPETLRPLGGQPVAVLV